MKALNKEIMINIFIFYVWKKGIVMKKTMIVVALTLMLSSVAHAGLLGNLLSGSPNSGRYVATYQDTSVAQMLTRWAAEDGKTIAWYAPNQYPISNPQALNQQAGLAQARNISDAFSRVGMFLQQSQTQGGGAWKNIIMTMNADPGLQAYYFSSGSVEMVICPRSNPRCFDPKNLSLINQGQNATYGNMGNPAYTVPNTNNTMGYSQ
jgi:hypothetical protein